MVAPGFSIAVAAKRRGSAVEVVNGRCASAVVEYMKKEILLGYAKELLYSGSEVLGLFGSQ